MKKIIPLLYLSMTAAVLVGCSSTQPASQATTGSAFTIDQLLSRMPAKDSVEARWIFSSLMQTGETSIVDICKRLGPAGSERNAQAEFALQGMAKYVAVGREPDRLLFVSALSKALETPMPVVQSSFLIARLQFTGKSESIGTLSRFLKDDRLYEPAAQAMVAIRDGAEAAFLVALPAAVRNPRVTIIKSLGDLRSRNAVDPLMKEASSEDSRIRLTALFALANIGDARAEQVLEKAAMNGQETERDECTWYYILFARRQNEAGNNAKTVAIAKELYTSRSSLAENHFRAVSLELMVEAKGDGALDDLIAATNDASKELRFAALRLLSRIQGEAATTRLISAAKLAPPQVRAEIIYMLGQRGDKSAYPAIAASLSDPDSAVRASAIDAAWRLRGADAIHAYFLLLEHSQEAGDVAAVKFALERIQSTQVITPVIESLPHVTAPACVMLLNLLGTYGTTVPVDPIVTLVRSENSSVRLAAIRTLGAISTEKDLTKLIDLLTGSDKEEERAAVQRSIVSVCSRISDSEQRSNQLLDAYHSASGEQKGMILRTLGRIGGSSALKLTVEQTADKDPDVRDAAVRALAEWPTIDAYDNLLTIAKSKEKLNLRVLAIRGCVRIVESASLDPVIAARYHEKTLAAAERIEEKRLVLGTLGNLKSREALRLVIPYIADDSLGLDASMAAGKIAAGKPEKKGDLGSSQVARTFIELKVPGQFLSQVEHNFDVAAGMNNPPEGFRTLFNGRNLNGWKGLVENPVVRAKMDLTQFAAAQARADSSMRAHWSVVEGILTFDGKGENICTSRDYGDFEMLVDWKIEKNGDSGIYLRGSPQVQIWDPAQWPEGSGGLYNNQKNPAKPTQRADKPIGEWNTFRIRMIGERVTVYLNEVLVVDSVIMENYWDRSIPIFAAGQIELQSHSTPLYFRNVFIREFPQKKTLFAGSLFNGKDLTGWKIIDGKEGNWGVQDGILFTSGEGGGWLSTDREYDNFQLDLDFRVVTGGNSGVFLRSPREGDPAYTGMEIQVLDDYAPEYAKLNQWQYCGSIYGVQAPSVRATKKAGEWEHYTIIANGPHITITLNDQLIVDADLISHMDKESTHPGLKRRSGFIGLQCHTSRVEYRNITIKELE